MKMNLGFNTFALPPLVVDYTVSANATYTETVTKPSGYTKLTIACYGAGSRGGSNGKTISRGGSGGAYSGVTEYDVSAIGAVYISVGGARSVSFGAGGDSFVRETNSGGTIICLAKGGSDTGSSNATGGLAASGTGSVKYSGGSTSNAEGDLAGAGAAGPSGNGGDAIGNTGGTAGGGLAGAGGNAGSSGSDYGGGSSYNSSLVSGKGLVRLTWS